MKSSLQLPEQHPRVVASATRPSSTSASESDTINDSTRQVAQRQQIATAFGPSAQLSGSVVQRKAEDRVEFFSFLEEENEYQLSGNQYAWSVAYEGLGNGNQGLKLSHLHIFTEMNTDSLDGQVTVRAKEADGGGPRFTGTADDVSEGDIRSDVIGKFGGGTPGQDNRDLVVRGLWNLLIDVKKAWAKWKREKDD